MKLKEQSDIRCWSERLKGPKAEINWPEGLQLEVSSRRASCVMCDYDYNPPINISCYKSSLIVLDGNWFKRWNSSTGSHQGGAEI